MTRIIQRCFLVLAFTGVLLSSAQETTVSGTSESKLNELTSPSAPKSSSLVEYSSSNTSTENSEEKYSAQSDSGTSTFKPETKTVGKKEQHSNASEDTLDENHRNASTDAGEDEISSNAATTEIDDGGHKNNFEELASLENEENKEKFNFQDAGSSYHSKSQTLEVSDVEQHNLLHSSINATEETAKPSPNVVSKSGESETSTTDTKIATIAATENDSKQSSVPSGDEMIHNSSYVDSNKFLEKVITNAPSIIQTNPTKENSVDKSVTRKRSLNATNTAVSSSGKIEAIMNVTAPYDSSDFTEIIYAGNNEDGSKLLPSKDSTEASYSKETREVKIANVFSTSGALEIETGSNHAVKDYTNMSYKTRSGVNSELEHFTTLKPFISSSGDSHKSSALTVALSTTSSHSIHPQGSISTTPHAFIVSSASAVPERSHEKIIEKESVNIPPKKVTSSVITFDPNGITHSYTQDPDSVTFSPKIFHVGGLLTNEYLSPLKSNDSVSNIEGHSYGGKSDITMHDDLKEEKFSENETLPGNQGMLPHDEPDTEEKHYTLSSVAVKERPSPTDSSTKFESTSVTHFALPLNDESEEMLNDSLHFIRTQSNPANSVTRAKIEESSSFNVSKDITRTISSSTQDVVNELDHTIDYQTEQSVVRPVTVTTFVKSSEVSTLLPDVLKTESHSPPEVTNSGQPDTVLPDISSPNIQPNPAPILVNQSAEVTTVVLQPILPEKNISDQETEKGNNTTPSGNSTIAGIAVKTSVSVSLPLSKISNSSINPNGTQVMHFADISFEENETRSDPSIISMNKAVEQNPSSVTPTKPSTVSTTESSRFRIRKPKIKFTDDDGSESPITRKPFVPALQRPSTTVGPAVSIFKKSRTRMGSITSSTTAKPFSQFSTIRIHYANRMPGMVPDGELVFSLEPITTTIPTTTETEEPFSVEPFTDATQVPSVSSEDNVTLVKVAGCIVVDKGLRWSQQLGIRNSPQYKERTKFMHLQLQRLFRSSPIASRLWKIQIDGFSVGKNRSVVVDFYLYLIKTGDDIPPEHLTSVFHEKLKNNTFSRFKVDTSKTTFVFSAEEPLKTPPPPLEDETEPPIPQWAIAVIVIGAASLIFIILFAAVTMYGRHHMRRRYSNKLNDEDSDRPGEWESKMAAAYENLAADTIYDAEDMHSETYKKSYLVD